MRPQVEVKSRPDPGHRGRAWRGQNLRKNPSSNVRPGNSRPRFPLSSLWFVCAPHTHKHAGKASSLFNASGDTVLLLLLPDHIRLHVLGISFTWCGLRQKSSSSPKRLFSHRKKACGPLSPKICDWMINDHSELFVFRVIGLKMRNYRR